MNYTSITVEELYNMTKANHDKIFNKHVKEFYADIMRECKKGYYEVILCPRDYEDQCNEPLRAVYDAVEHIRTLFKGIKIVENDEHPGQMCDGYYFEAAWDLEVITPDSLPDPSEYQPGRVKTGTQGAPETVDAAQGNCALSDHVE